jgi:hypothetical protein
MAFPKFGIMRINRIEKWLFVKIADIGGAGSIAPVIFF